MIAALLGRVAASPWAQTLLRSAAIGLAILLFMLSFRRSGERAGRMVERIETLEKTNEIQRHMLEAVARRPHDRGQLADRLRDRRF
jgi:hypothetical protein